MLQAGLRPVRCSHEGREGLEEEMGHVSGEEGGAEEHAEEVEVAKDAMPKEGPEGGVSGGRPGWMAMKKK